VHKQGARVDRGCIVPRPVPVPPGPRPLRPITPVATQPSPMQVVNDILRARATPQLRERLPAIALRPPPHVLAQQSGRGLLLVQMRPPRPWFPVPSALSRDAGGARAPGASASSVPGHPYSPPICGPRLAEEWPAPTAALGGPTEDAKLSLTSLGSEVAGLEVSPRSAHSSTEVVPPTCSFHGRSKWPRKRQKGQ